MLRIPRKSHAALPLTLMSVLYWFSSLAGSPVQDDPAVYGLFHWLSPLVHNALHVPAYAALSLSWHWALRAWLTRGWAIIAGAWLITSSYGLFDEWHQSSVPGRYASVGDIALDLAGATLGIWLAVRLERRTRAPTERFS